MAEDYGNGHTNGNGNGRDKILYRLSKVDVGYARLAQFWTALAVTVIGGIVIAQYTQHTQREDTIEQMVEVDRGRIGVIEEKQSRHETEINGIEVQIGKVNDSTNDHVNKVNDAVNERINQVNTDVIHLRERVVCVEHKSTCADRVPD